MERIKKWIDSFTRPSRKWTDILPIAIIISVIVMFVGEFLSLVIIKYLGIKELFMRICGREDIAAFMLQYFEFCGIWIAILLIVVIFKPNRVMLKSFGHNRKGNNIKGYLIGLLLGFGTNAICVLISLLMGDIKLSFFGFDPIPLLLFLFVVTVQSGAEELVDRFYLYLKLRRRYRSPLVAILGNSVIFTLLHALNPGFSVLAALQIFCVAVVFSELVYYYDGLWIAIAFHTAWNYTQNIIFGLPNSGIVSAYSIFNLEAASARSGLFYNVNFGVEGSVGASLVLILTGVAIWLLNRGRKERTDHWKMAEVKETETGL